jgi:hypothetical protein
MKRLKSLSREREERLKYKKKKKKEGGGSKLGKYKTKKCTLRT